LLLAPKGPILAHLAGSTYPSIEFFNDCYIQLCIPHAKKFHTTMILWVGRLHGLQKKGKYELLVTRFQGAWWPSPGDYRKKPEENLIPAK
jgi:hypothetical protein